MKCIVYIGIICGWLLFPFFLKAQTSLPLDELSFASLDDREISLGELKSTQIAAFFFLSPECPLCENYSLTINQLRKKYPEKDVAFYGIFPGKFFSKEEIQAYITKFQVKVTVLLDPEYQLRDLFEATVTPEVFLVNAAGEVLYKGSIDNWIPALGKKRTVINRHYLNDAIAAVLSGDPITIAETKAIGCFIE